jgi:hypothetical protein
MRDAGSTNLELLDSAHSPHILLIRLGKSWPCWIGLGVDVVPSFSIVNAVEGVFLLRDITQGGMHRGLVVDLNATGRCDFWCVRHVEGFAGDSSLGNFP